MNGPGKDPAAPEKPDGDQIQMPGTAGEMATGTDLKRHIHRTHLHANGRLPTRVCTQSSWTVINVTVVPYESVRLAP
jgi:hypothetical protein